MFREGQRGSGGFDWDWRDARLWEGMRSRGQRFGKHETRKVCVFIIRA